MRTASRNIADYVGVMKGDLLPAKNVVYVHIGASVERERGVSQPRKAQESTR